MNTDNGKFCRGKRMRRVAGGLAAAMMGAALCFTIQSCEVGPSYHRPKLEVPGAYKSATQPETEASSRPAVHSLGTNWWVLFADPQLTALEDAATRNNPDLQAATQRVIQAREAARAVKSQFYPVITLDPSASVAQNSNRSFFGGTSSNTGRIPFDLSYEVDLWGRVRRSYESSAAQAQATAAAYYVVLQTLQSDVAQNYFNLRSLDAQSMILARNVELYRQQLDLTHLKERAQLLHANSIDSMQVQTLLDSTKAQQIDIRRQRADLEHALAILTGRPPSDLSLPNNPLTDAPPVIPAGLPIDLLRRRPDVAEAEQNLVAANADIGVAKADFLPRLSLTASAGLESADLGMILAPESRFLSIGPSLSVPIFEGGRLTAELKQAKSRYLELVATYRSSVLTALRDVEDSLNDLHLRAEQAAAQDQAVKSARELYRLTNIQLHQGGLITQLDLIDADRTLLNNELTAQQILNQRLISTVLLIKAMGGGWQAPGAATRPDRAHLPAVPNAAADLPPATFPAALPATLPATRPTGLPATAP